MLIKNMWNNISLRGLTVLFLLSLSVLSSAQTQSLDKVLVVVDDDVILQSEYEIRLAQVLNPLSEEEIAGIPKGELREQIIDQLILESLQIQMSYRAGIRVDDNMLNQAMANIAENNGMSFERFANVLQADGVYNSTRQQISKEISINQLQSTVINRRINITGQEIENYLRSETGQSDIAPEFHVAHILIPNNASAPLGSTEELANLLHQQIIQGANILEIATAGEISGLAINGGDLGWNKAETLPGIFLDVVPDMEPGSVSEPFTSPSGFHLVQLLETRGGTDLQLEQTHLRHIVIQPNEIRTEAQAEELIHQLYQQIVDGEDFADIARKNTDDANTMVSGGDLGWIREGQISGEYMVAIEDAEIGELKAPFKVSTGWYIIEVLERQMEDVTEENKIYQAQLILRDRKYENEKENWLTEIRDEAYVDLKEE